MTADLDQVADDSLCGPHVLFDRLRKVVEAGGWSPKQLTPKTLNIDDENGGVRPHCPNSQHSNLMENSAKNAFDE